MHTHIKTKPICMYILERQGRRIGVPWTRIRWSWGVSRARGALASVDRAPPDGASPPPSYAASLKQRSHIYGYIHVHWYQIRKSFVTSLRVRNVKSNKKDKANLRASSSVRRCIRNCSSSWSFCLRIASSSIRRCRCSSASNANFSRNFCCS